MVDLNRKVPSNPNSMPFVSFPGNDIKDLFVHDGHEEVSSAPIIPTAAAAFGNPEQPAPPAAAPVMQVQQQVPMQPPQIFLQQPHPQQPRPQPLTAAVSAQIKPINMAPTNPWGNPNSNAKKPVAPISAQPQEQFQAQMQGRQQQARESNINGNSRRQALRGGRGSRGECRAQAESQGVAGTGEYLQTLRTKKNADGKC